jgi:hypothetical protein
MQFGARLAVYSKNRDKLIYIYIYIYIYILVAKCGDFNVKADGTDIYHCALKDYKRKAGNHVSLRSDLAPVCDLIPSVSLQISESTLID